MASVDIPMATGKGEDSSLSVGKGFGNSGCRYSLGYRRIRFHRVNSGRPTRSYKVPRQVPKPRYEEDRPDNMGLIYRHLCYYNCNNRL